MEENEITLPIPTEEANEPQEAVFATVAAVYSDGLSLLFDGAESASEKHYLCNKSVYFTAGNRVKLCRDSGTIVVEYPIGAPKLSDTHGIPAGGSAGQILTKASAASYDATWQNGPAEAHGIPSGGSSGQILTKVNATDYNASWQNAPTELPTGGAQAAALMKKSATSGDVEWKRINGVQNQYDPSSGPTYDIQFRTTHLGSNANFQIRMGPNGTWKTLTVT